MSKKSENFCFTQALDIDRCGLGSFFENVMNLCGFILVWLYRIQYGSVSWSQIRCLFSLSAGAREVN